MPQIINSNVSSLVTQNNLNRSQNSLSTSLERLSSGLRINSAKDDAAGLAISDRATTQINGFTVAARNANDAISLSQTAEGSLSAVGNNLQRIRELALQSANSTNSASDRQALNAEAQQLISEVQRVGTTTQFNGLNLLDGTFSSAQFQVGANANQTINVSIQGATTNILGAYQATSTAVTANALTGTNFSINGVQIGASAATSAAGFTAGSAAAKAVAINASSANTGVSATAVTTVSGFAPIAGSGLANGALTINGISVGSIASDGSAVTQGNNAATAINAISNQTGVNATVNLSTGAITLTSSEGRDIALASSAGTAAGADAIFNATGLDVSTGSNPTGNSTNSVTIGSGGVAAATAANTIAAGETVTVDGIQYEFQFTGTAASAGHVKVDVGANAAAATQAATGTALALAINAQHTLGTTSVSAVDAGAGVVNLTNNKLGAAGLTETETVADAAGITLGSAGGTGGTASGAYVAQTTRGTLTLSSASNFTLSGSALADAGLSAVNPSLSRLSGVDISTVAGSNSAIAVLDGALAQVNSQRASLGAYQNRFAATVDNLQTSAQNLTAARSRTRDADFASETANLSRSQVLQQAGIAILSQANSLPQQVLSLLR